MKKNSGNKRWIKGVVGNVLYPIIALGLLFALWAIVAAAYKKPLVLPMPDAVVSRFFSLFAEEYFWNAVLSSLLRTFISFVVSFFAAYLFAFAAAKAEPLGKILDTVVAVLRAAPTVAVILIAYAFMSSRTMSVVVGFLIAFPILYSNFLTALRGVDNNLITMAKIYKVKKSSVLINVYFLNVLPSVFDVCRATSSLTLKVVIAAEILTSVSKSVGGAIKNANSTFEIDYLLAWTCMAIVLSFLLEITVSLLKKLCVRWTR